MDGLRGWLTYDGDGGEMSAGQVVAAPEISRSVGGEKAPKDGVA